MTPVKPKRCRHGAARPWTWGRYGVFWCYNCGALRMLVQVEGRENAYEFDGPWLYPRGLDDVMRQLERWRRKRATLSG